MTLPPLRRCAGLGAALVLVAALSGSLACVSAGAPSPWVRARTPNVEVWSNASLGRTQALASELEQFHRLVARLPSLPFGAPRVPIRVTLIHDRELWARTAPDASLAGFERLALDASHVVLDGTRRQLHATARHVYAHALARTGAVAPLPPWLDEGLADLLGRTRRDAGQWQVGYPSEVWIERIRLGSPHPLRSVLGASAVPDGGPGERALYYAQAWALTHQLWIGPPRRGEELRSFLERSARGLDPGSAFASAFGQPLDDFEAEHRRRLAAGAWTTLRLTEYAADFEVALEALPEFAREIRLGEIAHALGARARAERHFASAAAAAPDEPRTAARLARSLAMRGAEGAEAWLERALATRPGDAEIEWIAGDTRLALAGASDANAPAQIARARAHYERSLEADPKQVGALAGLALARSAGPEGAASAVDLLEIAARRLPAHSGLALRLAELELARGARAAARRAVARALPPAHGPPSPDAPRARVAALRNRLGFTPELPDAAQLTASVRLDAPREGAVVRGPIPWLAVRGAGGLTDRLHHDVVIAIDASSTMLGPSGIDLDGDGHVGRGIPHPLARYIERSTDPEDALVEVGRSIARGLIDRVDPSTTRIGLLKFSARHIELAPLGPPSAALAALEGFTPRFDGTGTSLQRALQGSLRMLAEADDAMRTRVRTVVLLTDGDPTVPDPQRGHKRAREAAAYLAKNGVRVHAVALGEVPDDEWETLRSIASQTAGRFVRVVDPARLQLQLAVGQHRGLESIELLNRASVEPSRAVRVLPDGSFDGFVPLVAGENQIEVVARVEGREPVVQRRRVIYEPGPAQEPEALREAAQLVLAIRRRTNEISLAREAQAGRIEREIRELERAAGVSRDPRQVRQLELEPEEREQAGPDVAAPRPIR